MGDRSPPTIVSRWRRLIEYLRHNRSRIVVDVALLATWVIVAATVFRLLGLPTWLLYLILFVGVIVYARVTPSWERPYRSPD